MKPCSLRMRLLIGAAVAIFAALAAAWVSMTLLFDRHIERRVEAELTRNALQLVASLRLGADDAPLIDAPPADPRFDTPTSGLYWQISTPAGTLRSRSLWDQALPGSPRAQSTRWATRVAAGPFGQQLLLLERRIRPDRTGAQVLVQLGYDRTALRSASAEFGLELGLFLALLWVILSAAAWAQVHLGLKPLARVRDELEALQRNPEARLLAADAREIEPLTRAINALAEAREKDLVWARRRAADLAHGLKTPLAALSAQSRRARDAGAIEAADGLDRAIAAATMAVETELARIRVATIRQAPRNAECSPREVVERLVGVVERTDFGAELVFDVEVPEQMRVPLAVEDLNELLGAVIENAARFARRQVRICGACGPRLTLSVQDDGPGLGDAWPEDVLIRHGRLDEAGAGHGLGLSIARELAEATGGQIELQRAALGGLAVTVAWALPEGK